MVGHHMDSRVAPAMQLANQTGEPLYLEVHVADQGFGTGVAELVEFFVAEYGQERTKTGGRFRKGFDIVDVVTRCSTFEQECLAIGSDCHVLAVDPGMEAIALNLHAYRRLGQRQEGGHANRCHGWHDRTGRLNLHLQIT